MCGINQLGEKERDKKQRVCVDLMDVEKTNDRINS